MHLVLLKSGEKFVVLFQEADKPFQRGFVREQIPEKDFGTRFVNGKSLADLVRSALNDLSRQASRLPYGKQANTLGNNVSHR